MNKTRKEIAELVKSLLHSDNSGPIADFTLNISCVGEIFEVEYKTHKQGDTNE